MQTLRSCGRSVRADARFERTLRSRGRSVRADAPFARTLRSRGRSVRADLDAPFARTLLLTALLLIGASAPTERPSKICATFTALTEGLGHGKEVFETNGGNMSSIWSCIAHMDSV